MIINQTLYFKRSKWKPLIVDTYPDIFTDYRSVEFLDDGRLMIVDNHPSIPMTTFNLSNASYHSISVGGKMQDLVMDAIRAHPEITPQMVEQLKNFKEVHINEDTQ